MKNCIVGFLALMMVSCGYNNTQIPQAPGKGPSIPQGPQAPGKEPGNPQGPQLDFATVKTQVFEVHCMHCHSSAGGNRAGINLETYTSVKPLASLIQSAVSSGFMPPSGNMPDSVKTLLNNWIQAGAPEVALGTNNSTQPPPEAGTPTKPTPGIPPIPCEDHKHMVATGELVEIDNAWVFDVTDQTLKGRHDDCPDR